MLHLLQAIPKVLTYDVTALLLLPLVALAVAHTAVGVGRSRQGYMLSALFVLTALAGFLLNPLADATTRADLRTRLTGYEVLTLLCIVQFLLAGAAAMLGLRLDNRAEGGREAILLAIVHAVPVPVLIIAMLLWEQSALALTPGTRPEAIARQIGLGVATLLTLSAAVALWLPARWLAPAHSILSVAMILACMFLPLLQDPLPQSLALMDWQSLVLLLWLVPPLGAVLLLGAWWPARRGRLTDCTR